MSDIEDLTAYRTCRDADSFRRLVLRHQSMVYSTCCRTLGSPPEAEDASQETFLKLAKSAGSIRGNLGAWLYVCALNTARKRRDSVRARRRREEDWSQMQQPENAENWRELVPVIDDCIAELPEDDRELLVQHYFAGRAQTDLAVERGVSQQAAAKRLQRIVDTLRQALRGKGVTVSAVVLGAFLTESTGSATVPASLTASLCKIGLVGFSGASGGTVAGVTGAGVLGGKSAAVVAAGVLVVLSGAMAHRHRTRPHTEDVAAPVAQQVPPQETPAAREPAPPPKASPRIGDVAVAAAPAAQPARPQEAPVPGAADDAEPRTARDVLSRMVEARKSVRTASYEFRTQCEYVEPLRSRGVPRHNEPKGKIIVPAGTLRIYGHDFVLDGCRYRSEQEGPLISMSGPDGTRLRRYRRTAVFDGETLCTIYPDRKSARLKKGARLRDDAALRPLFEYHFGLLPQGDVALRLAKRDDWQGRECYVLTEEFGPIRTSYWIDAERDWTLVREAYQVVAPDKRRFWSNARMSWRVAILFERECEIVYERDTLGVWRPAGWIKRLFGGYGPDRTLETVWTTHVDKASLNTEIPEFRFEFDIPDGTQVYDED